MYYKNTAPVWWTAERVGFAISVVSLFMILVMKMMF